MPLHLTESLLDCLTENGSGFARIPTDGRLLPAEVTLTKCFTP